MAGRPTVWTPELNSKIEECAALGASIEEIAYYAGVHRTTLYRWMAEMPELKDRIIELQERPILKARQTVVNHLDEPEMALKYLERKRKNEFSLRQEYTGKDGAPLQIISWKDDNSDITTGEEEGNDSLPPANVGEGIPPVSEEMDGSGDAQESWEDDCGPESSPERRDKETK